MKNRNFNHKDWVKYQFKLTMLKPSYRNILVHFSLIESFLVGTASEEKFSNANKILLCTGVISSDEFCLFDLIRKKRNKLVHRIYKRKLKEVEINKSIAQLMDKILEAYKMSNFLNKLLSEKYDIDSKASLR